MQGRRQEKPTKRGPALTFRAPTVFHTGTAKAGCSCPRRAPGRGGGGVEAPWGDQGWDSTSCAPVHQELLQFCPGYQGTAPGGDSRTAKHRDGAPPRPHNPPGPTRPSCSPASSLPFPHPCPPGSTAHGLAPWWAQGFPWCTALALHHLLASGTLGTSLPQILPRKGGSPIHPTVPRRPPRVFFLGGLLLVCPGIRLPSPPSVPVWGTLSRLQAGALFST
ncbi:PREDICTED: uncharacterized protein LOC102027167 [Chinchilla lanigera]|uniref:uncharacterized protein LOC102027167 n=1 Tax=Chinchilla lanigera TaxID=34839 RepID=UPI00038F070F|nr:PREDICTED: uncharacterized protein LOC102027167 [Chinchilla lanigera]